ncbi:MAG: hypothetical protein GY705_09645 [Bacteroidetes bacterium]|nr:hypothetical protein [Bacteroidota bacterium]
MKKSIPLLLMLLSLSFCQQKPDINEELIQNIQQNETFDFVKNKALEIVKTGFNAGDGYGEVWIRDYNTFIELSCEVFDQETIKENLLVFFRMQGEDGNILDGFIPAEKAVASEGGYEYRFSDLEPRYAGHKNTVETDQESSLIQAVYKYIKKTKDNSFLQDSVGNIIISERMEKALVFLMAQRYNEEYGLLWGATTADWGDVQPEHNWGVYLTEDTHYSLDIYDNAMFVIALQNFIELVPAKADKWKNVKTEIEKNIRTHLWDSSQQKFKAHVYLNGSPFPESFDENAVFYHGGTAVAIEAGLLSKEEIKISIDKMVENVKVSGAASIGLTLYPPYPEGSFQNKGMYPYGYQNGGDWTWFGGRMIQELIRNGFVKEAFEQAAPMMERVQSNDGFYEWYSVDNEPKGSGTFRGSAGVLYKAIELFENWAEEN